MKTGWVLHSGSVKIMQIRFSSRSENRVMFVNLNEWKHPSPMLQFSDTHGCLVYIVCTCTAVEKCFCYSAVQLIVRIFTTLATDLRYRRIRAPELNFLLNKKPKTVLMYRWNATKPTASKSLLPPLWYAFHQPGSQHKNHTFEKIGIKVLNAVNPH